MMKVSRVSPAIGISMGAIHVEGRRKHACNDTYVDCVRDAGGLPVLLPSLGAEPELAAEEYLDRVGGLLLTGGEDVHPSFYGEAARPELEEVDEVRDRFEIALARAAHRRGIPTLSICRGVQVANVALGGSLVQDIPSQTGSAVRHRPGSGEPMPTHEVEVVAGTRLRHVLGVDRARVNSHHHQSAGRVAPGLRVAARSSDGVIEALEDPRHPYFLGVQWHPEKAAEDPLSRAVFRAFLDACRRKVPVA